ncbi:MAG: hypothetical protein ACXQS8_06375 [Candidatus Helarchaeales archaeon]
MKRTKLKCPICDGTIIDHEDFLQCEDCFAFLGYDEADLQDYYLDDSNWKSEDDEPVKIVLKEEKEEEETLYDKIEVIAFNETGRKFCLEESERYEKLMRKEKDEKRRKDFKELSAIFRRAAMRSL